MFFPPKNLVEIVRQNSISLIKVSVEDVMESKNLARLHLCWGDSSRDIVWRCHLGYCAGT